MGMKVDERHTSDMQYIRPALVGVDEAGRGPLAGPLAVCAFAVFDIDVLDALCADGLVRDSKLLSPRQRELLFREIRFRARAGSFAYRISFVSPRVIDRIGIAGAARRGVARALARLHLDCARTDVRLDGCLAAPSWFTLQRTIVRGDRIEPAISLASVCAKVARDRVLKRLATRYPDYAFDAHKGYGTQAHYRAIARMGITPEHRVSFLSKILTQ